MTTGPDYPASDNDEPEMSAEQDRKDAEARRQRAPQGGRPGETPIGPPYGGREHPPEQERKGGLPGEWHSDEEQEPPRERPSGSEF
ncbi:hypothetical protein [Bailinhaonella thermotolerans]|uniref:Uncharacterized protein n=1 Tax=Bailinhaonella thermotolerans TaxID=1070861 RepID=A0A3A4AQH9_9ACTN|nr:hypothetical protein [Bailinhaonella thermotolerans]RJL31966.1 hypothetical protein D5H75_16100 [Bailinhaonella thermotolerans]